VIEFKHARMESTRKKSFIIDTRSDQMTDGSDNAFLFWIDLNARGTLAQPVPTPAGKPTVKHELGLNVLTPPEVVAPGGTHCESRGGHTPGAMPAAAASSRLC
jgi:hypothetical protein